MAETVAQDRPHLAEAVRNAASAVEHASEKVEKTAMFGINSQLVRTVMQGGFALLVGYLFFVFMMEQKTMLSSLISKTEERNERAEQMFREEVREQRKAHWEATKDIRGGLDGVKAAMEKNTEAQKQTTEEIKKLARESGENP